MQKPLQGIVGITGTPGTGKKSIAPLVAGSLGVPCIGLNSFAEARGLVGKWGDVDVPKLKRAVEASLEGPAVLYGHLLPFAIGHRRLSMAVVLRCEPSVLKARLASRGYPSAKVMENVEAELIGTVSADAIRAFGGEKVVEVDTTQTDPARGAAKAVAAVTRKGGTGPTIDWMPNYGSGPKLRSLMSPG